MDLLDTNIIVRYLTDDLPEQAERARTAFDAVEAGTLVFVLSEGVLVETEQVLSSKNLYNLPRDVIARHLTRLLRIYGVKIDHKQTYLRAFELYVAHHFLSFVDCVCVAHAERLGNIDVMSFDKGFDRIRADTAVNRIEP